MGSWDGFFSGIADFVDVTKKVGLNVVTLGGHHKLEAARARYRAELFDFERSGTAYKSADNLFKEALANLNIEAKESMGLLLEARNVVEGMSWKTISSHLPCMTAIQVPSIKAVDQVLSEMNSTIESGKGAGIGVAAGAGAWLLVAHLGVASTGAAIGGLSGVAATNAILAWFGGGALAAGGGGIALGGLVLGGLTIVPGIAFGAYRTYTEASRIEAESEGVRVATLSNWENTKKIGNTTEKVVALTTWTTEQNSLFSCKLQAFRDRAIQLANEIALVSNTYAEELSAQTRATNAPQ